MLEIARFAGVSFELQKVVGSFGDFVVFMCVTLLRWGAVSMLTDCNAHGERVNVIRPG